MLGLNATTACDIGQQNDALDCDENSLNIVVTMREAERRDVPGDYGLGGGGAESTAKAARLSRPVVKMPVR